MRFSDLCEKEVVNVKDCRCLGSVRDLDIDKECGRRDKVVRKPCE